jgi:cysteine synthase A
MALADFFTLSWVRSGLWDRLRIQRRVSRDLIIGLVVGITFSLSSTSLALLVQQWRRKRAIARIPPRPIELRSDEIVDGVTGLIGESRVHRSARPSKCLDASWPRWSTPADVHEVILPYYVSTR